MRKFTMVLLIIVVVGFCSAGWSMLIEQSKTNTPAALGQNELIRLHVLANSDDPEDQKLKLKVRDAVISYLAPQLAHVANIETAREIVQANQKQLVEVAQQVLLANGSQYPVNIKMGLFDFPLKSYGNFVLPAGQYEAVRILIGKAEGKNWWCVLFPPLCFIDVTNAAAVPVNTEESDQQAASSANAIEFRWKIAELWNGKKE